MKKYLDIQDIRVEVTRKSIKNLNLRVYPSEGRVALSCPFRTRDHEIKSFVIDKKSWIEKKLEKGKNSPPKIVLNYETGENIPVWGNDLCLRVYIASSSQRVCLNRENNIQLYVRKNSTREKRETLIREWYRSELKRVIPILIKKWEPVMGVVVTEFGVKKMKTRWGTCNIRDKRIWLNLELAKKDPACLEYIVVHEMVHLLERLHNKRFYKLMDRFLPDWRETDKILKQ